MNKRLVCASVPSVLCKNALFVFTYTVVSAVWCCCYITLDGRENNPVNLYYYFPERTVSSTMNNDANSFARHEPNAPPGQEEPIRAQRRRRSHRRGLDWDSILLDPRLVLRLSTELPWTRLVPCQKKKRRVRQSLKTLRRSFGGRVLAGNREPDISRVKLANRISRFCR